MNPSATPLFVAGIAMTLGIAPIVQAEDQPSPTPVPIQPEAPAPEPSQLELTQPATLQSNPLDRPAPAWVVNLRSDIINQPRIGASIEPINPPVSPPAPAIEPADQSPQTQPEPSAEVAQPEASQPEVAQPEPVQPDVSQPEAAQPATVPPEAAQPEAAQPEAAQPEAAQPEISPEASEPLAQPTQQNSPAASPAVIPPIQSAEPPIEPQPNEPSWAPPLPDRIIITPEFGSPLPSPDLAPDVESNSIGPSSIGPSSIDQPTPIPSIQPQSSSIQSSPIPSAPLDLASPAQAEALKTLDSPMIAVSQPLPDDWWHQGAQSPIAIAIGNAEGTRTPDGGKNDAYYWHQDPGNGANNFGTFSYQHLSDREQTPVDRQPNSDQKRHQAARQGLPETADRRQLVKLQSFYQQLLAQAHLRGLALSELEILNGLDLANQSEEAALDSWGYIDRLIQAKSRTADPQEQIDQARTWSYWNPKHNRWDAPGLGNHYDGIRHDQQRRSAAVTTALARQQSQAILAQSSSLLTLNPPIVAQAPATPAEHQDAIETLTTAILRFEMERVN
jgi:hypothetical protein